MVKDGNGLDGAGTGVGAAAEFTQQAPFLVTVVDDEQRAVETGPKPSGSGSQTQRSGTSTAKQQDNGLRPQGRQPPKRYLGAMSSPHVDPDDTDLRFALQIIGAELAEGPPPADSPLGRLRRFTAANPGTVLTADHIRRAIDGTLPLTPPDRP